MTEEKIFKLLCSTNPDDNIIGLRFLKPLCKDRYEMERQLRDTNVFLGQVYVWADNASSSLCEISDLDDIPYKSE